MPSARVDIVRQKVVEYERRVLERALRKYGTQVDTAAALGMTKDSLQYRLALTGVDAGAIRRKFVDARREARANAKRAASDAAKLQNESRRAEARECAARKAEATRRRRAGKADDPQWEERERHIALRAAERKLRRDLGPK